MKRVAITGIGLIDSLGNNPQDCFLNYLTKDNYPTPYNDEWDFLSDKVAFFANHDLLKPEKINNSTYAALDKVNKMALHSVEQSLQGLPVSKDVGLVFSTITASQANVPNFIEYTKGNAKKVRPKVLLQGVKDYAVGLIPQIYDFTGANTSMFAACATTLYNLDYALHLVDDYDYVLCGGSDEGTNYIDSSFFKEIGAMGSYSAPFNDERDGFIMGEGSGCLVLESEEKAKARGAKIYGYICGIGKASDGSEGKPTAPDINSSGAKKAMADAVKGIDTTQISFVNAHATSTPIGDDLEYNAIESIFPITPVVSFKSKIGHTMGSSGVVELIYTLMSLNNNCIPPNFNIKSCDLKNVITEKRDSDKKYALKNSLAFGGKNVSVLIERPDA